MTQKDNLIAQMREEAETPNFETVLSLLDSIPSLRSRKKGKTLSYYRQEQIVAALRTHTLIGSGTFVLSIPDRLTEVCPSALEIGRGIWGDLPLDDQSDPGNQESSFPMIVSDQTIDAAQEIIRRIFIPYAESGCGGLSANTTLHRTPVPPRRSA